MGYIFISYSKKDASRKEKLVKRLLKAKFEVWSDSDLPVGHYYAPIINDKIIKADVVITLWTKRSVLSKWVYFESNFAKQLNKLVPLQLEPCEIPFGLRDLNTIEYFAKNVQFDEDPFEELISLISETLKKQANQKENSAIRSLDDAIWLQIKESRDPQDFSDYLAWLPDGIHVIEAQSALHQHSRRKRRIFGIELAVGLLVYLMLCFPLLALFREFGFEKANFWMSLYFDFFAFGPVFGTLIVPIYIFTLQKALSFAYQSKPRSSERTRFSRITSLLVLVVFPIVASLIATSIETTTGYAPWQFTKTTLAQPVSSFDSRLTNHENLNDIFGRTRDLSLHSMWETRNDDLDKSVHCFASGRIESDKECAKTMRILTAALEKKLQDPNVRSLTNKAYMASFFFFALPFIGTYFTLLYTCTFAEKMRAWMAGIAPWSGRRFTRLLYLFMAQLLCIAVWFVARMLFQMETQTILPIGSGSHAFEVIRMTYFGFTAIYLLSIGSIVAATLRIKNRKTQIAIVAFALFTSIFLALSYSVTAFVRGLQSFVGVEAGSASITMLAILVCAVIFFPLVLPNMLPKEEDHLE